MSSSSAKKTTRTTSGFSGRDVKTFLNQGNTQSANSGKGDIGNLKPDLKHRSVITKDNTSGFRGMFGISDGTGSTTTTGGFLGKFSSLGQEDIDRLTTSFLQRQTNIKQRSAQPGRSAFLNRG